MEDLGELTRWKGRNLEDLTKEELIAAIKDLVAHILLQREGFKAMANLARSKVRR